MVARAGDVSADRHGGFVSLRSGLRFAERYDFHNGARLGCVGSLYSLVYVVDTAFALYGFSVVAGKAGVMACFGNSK